MVYKGSNNYQPNKPKKGRLESSEKFNSVTVADRIKEQHKKLNKDLNELKRILLNWSMQKKGYALYNENDVLRDYLEAL